MAVSVVVFTVSVENTEAALAVGGGTCTAQSKSAGTSLACTVATQNIEAGNIAVLIYGADNIATTDVTTQDLTSVTDSGGNTWTVQQCFTNGQGSAQAGATTCIATSRLTTQLTSGASTITANHSSVTARSIVVNEFTLTAGNILTVAGTIQTLANDTADPGSMTISSLTSGEYLFIRATNIERASGGTWTPTTNFTTMGCNGTTGGNAQTNVNICGERRIVTATSLASDPTGTSIDSASIFIAFKEEVPTIRFGGTLYTDEGITALTTSKTIKLMVGTSTPSIHSTTTSATGAWSLLIPASNLTAGKVITAWVDGDSTTRASVVTKLKDAGVTAISNLNLFKNRVIVRQEDNNATTTTNAQMGTYDGDNDADIMFRVTGNNLTVNAGNELYVQGSTYAPGGSVTVNGNASTTSVDGSLELANVSKNANDISTAVYASKSFSVTSQETTPSGIIFNADGTKMYITGTANDSVYQYTLSTAYDVSTASYASKSFSVASQVTAPESLAISSDGTKMYISGSVLGSGVVFQYTLSTPYDASTGSYASKSVTVNSQESSPKGVVFSADGTKMYVVGTANDAVYQYTLLTPWDVSTASYASKSFSVASQETNSSGLSISSDGTKMYVVGTTNDTVYQYTLGTAYDASTATYASKSFSIASQDGTSGDLIVSPDGQKFYMIGPTSDLVYQYAIGSTGIGTLNNTSTLTLAGNLTNGSAASFVNNGTVIFNATTTGKTVTSNGDALGNVSFAGTGAWTFADSEVGVTDLTISGGTVNAPAELLVEGTLTRSAGIFNAGETTTIRAPGFDISTAAFEGTVLSVGAQETFPYSMIFNNTGTVLYVMGFTGDDINKYTLSTPYDISTATFSSIALSVAGQDGAPYDMMFNNTGTVLYVLGDAGDDINAYTLSTPYDISTATFSSIAFSAVAQVGEPRAMLFNNTGTVLYILDHLGKDINAYTLSTPYDISTATFSSMALAVSTEETAPTAMIFNNTGTVLYLTGATGDDINAYTLSTPYDISTATFSSIVLSVAAQELSPSAMIFNEFGSTLYVMGFDGDDINAYSLDVQDQAIVGEFTGSSALENVVFGAANTTTIYNNASTTDFTIASSTTVVAPQTLTIGGDYTNRGIFTEGGVMNIEVNSTPGDLSTAVYNSKNKSVSSQQGASSGVTFSSDGTKMYVVGFSSATVYQYTLSTAWDVSTASYASKSFSVAQDTVPNDIAFSSDGTKMYIIGWTNDTVYQYTIGTPWDISTASYASKSFSVTSQESTPQGLFFSSNGSTMFVTGFGSGTLYQYTIGTPWDISTASYASKSFSFATQDSQPRSMAFNSSGTMLLMAGTNSDTLYQYTIGTPWDISTASYASKSFLVSSQSSEPTGISLGSDGEEVYIVDQNVNTVYQYSLVTIGSSVLSGTLKGTSALGSVLFSGEGTITFASNASTTDFTIADASTTVVAPTALTIGGDYTNNGIFTAGSGAVYLGEVGGYDISTASFAATVLSVAAQESVPLAMLFNNTGTVLYVMGLGGDDINAYTLSTPYDISTAVFSAVVLSVAAQDTDPQAMLFNNTGTVLYMLGSNSDSVHAYTLSTPYNISSGSFSSTVLSVAAQEFAPQSMLFNNTGTVLYVMGSTGDDVNAYTLGTPYDISTAVFSAVVLSVAAQDITPLAMLFNNTGTTFYVMGGDGDDINAYTLSTPYDISTATFQKIALSVASEDTQSYAMLFNNTGTILYVSGVLGDEINAYSLADSETQTLLGDIVGENAFNDLVVLNPNGAVFATTTTIAHNFTVATSGVAVAPSILTIEGDYANYGTFDTSASSTHVYTAASTSPQTFSGDMVGENAFYNFTVLASSTTFAGAASTTGTLTLDNASGTVAFAAGATSTFTNIVVNGTETQRISMVSTVADTLWSIIVPGTQNIQFADVEDSYACGGQSLNSLFGTLDNTFCWTADASYELTIAGTLFSDEGSTAITSGKTIKLAVGTSTPGIYTTTSDGNGDWSFDFTGTGVNATTPFVVWVDGDVTTRAAAVTVASSSNNSIADLDLYEDRVIVRHESGAATASTTNAKMGVYDGNDDADIQYRVSDPRSFDIQTATFADSFSVVAQEANPLGFTFSNDGLKMFVVGNTGDDVDEYTLGSAFDVSTASYVDSFSVAAQETSPSDLTFSNDGLKMFVIGSTGDDVNEYSLGSAFDVSTASFVDSFSVAAQDSNPSSLAFSTDGLKMFVVGWATADAVHEYNLSGAFDVSTASFVDSFSVTAQDTQPYGLAFSPSGFKMFVVGVTGDDVNEYTLSTAFDVSTASYVDSFSVATEETTPWGVAFSNDGLKMFVVGTAGDDINEYTLTGSYTDLTVKPGNELHVWNNTHYNPTGAVVLNGNAGGALDGSLHVDNGATTTASDMVAIAGNLAVDTNGSYVNESDYPTVFTATTTGKTLAGNLDNLGNTRFVGASGAWTFSNSATTSDLTIAAGTVTGPAGVLAIGGDYINSGTATYTGKTRAFGAAKDLSIAVFDEIVLSVAAQETFPTAMLFNNTGTTLYVMGSDGDDINAYTLSIPYDISTATFNSVVLSVAAQEATPTAMLFNNTGTVLYVMGTSGDDINAYTLSTPYDISTAAFSSIVLSVAAQETSPIAMLFNNTGTVLYVMGIVGDDINAYTLGTPYDISTAAFSSIVLSVAAQETSPFSMLFNNTGTTLYVMGASGDDINAYTLGTPYDISTAAFSSIVLSVSAQEANPYTMLFNNTGTTLYVMGTVDDDINKYILAHNFSGNMTGSNDFADFSVAEDGGVRFANNASTTDFVNAGLVEAPSRLSVAGDFANTGTYTHNSGTVYLTGTSKTMIGDFTAGSDLYNPQVRGSYAFTGNASTTDLTIASGATLTTAGNWTITDDYTNNGTSTISSGTLFADADGYGIQTATFVDSFSVTTPGINLNGLEFSQDGFKMFVVGMTDQEVNEYALSTAWDVSTASYVDALSVAAQDTSPWGLAFSSDGLKMFVIGREGDDVNEYTLSTAFDVSTASFVDSFSIAAQETDPNNITFSTDGLKMFVLGGSGRDINEYTLSTAWDVSTASFVDSFSVIAQESNPYGFVFSRDGLKLFVTGNINDSVYEYRLTAAFDVSTASFVDSLSVAAQNTDPRDIVFSVDGLKMFVIGNTSRNVHEYDLSHNYRGNMTGANAFNDFIVPGDAGLTFASSTTVHDLEVTLATTTVVLPTSFTVEGDLTNNGSLDSTTATTTTFVGPEGWDISTAVYTGKSKSVNSQDGEPRGLTFSIDGKYAYVLSDTSDSVYQYILSTAWDISTAVYSSKSKSIAAEETIPYSLAISSDGTKMFILGSGKDVNEYTLTLPFDVSTAMFVDSYSVNAQDTFPTGVAFSKDGLTMYIVGLTGKSVYQYTLTTAYDVSTASYASKSFSVAAQGDWFYTIVVSPTGGRFYLASNVTDRVYEYQIATLGDISTASYVRSFAITQGTQQYTVFIHPTGTYMYGLGRGTDTIYQYRLGSASTETQVLSGNFTLDNAFYDLRIANASSTVISDDLDTTNLYLGVGTTTLAANKTLAVEGDFVKSNKFVTSTSTVFVGPAGYRLDTAMYSGKSASFAGQDSAPNDVTLSLDGTKMYMTGFGTDKIFQYTLSAAYDVSTASYASKSVSVTTQEGTPRGSAFSPDGLKMFVVGSTNDTVYQYTLTTAWDVSTAAYASKSYSVAAQEGNPGAVTLSSDGTKMYIIGTSNNTIYQYTLSTAWDVSTAAYASKSYSVASQESASSGLFFHRHGLKMYVVGSANNSVFEYTLTTPWDVSTAAYASKSYSVASQESGSNGVFLTSDGARMYVSGATNDSVFQYYLATTTNTSRIVAGDFSGASSFDDLIFSENGTTSISGAITADDVVVGGGVVKAPREMTIAGDYTNAGRFVAQASSTAYFGPERYNISTGVFDGIALSVAAQDTAPTAMLFNHTGTVLYVLGYIGADINAYTLSTPYDISTATFSQIALSVAAQETIPTSMLFNNTGTVLYVMGYTGDDINAYTLSTPYDISTATFSQIALSVAAQEINPASMLFNNTGTVLYVLGDAGDDINAYTLSTPYDISTATFSSIVLSVAAEESSPFDMLFNNTGTVLYMMGYTGDDINAYSLSSETPTKQIISGNLSGTSAFENVTVTNISGTGSSTQSVWFSSPFDVTGTYTMWASTSAAFPASATTTINNFTLQGIEDQNVYLRSTKTGTQSILNVSGTQSVEYVNVRDSNACGGDDIVAYNTTDMGNNTCWTLIAFMNILGTLFSDEGSTEITSGKTIKLAIGTSSPSVHTTTSNGSGDFTFADVLASFSSATPILAWVDDGATTTAAVISIATSTNDIAGLDLYKNRVIVKHDDVTIDTMSFYDNDNSATIPYNASSTARTLTVRKGTELHISTGVNFIPAGTVTLHGNAGSGTDGSLHIDDNGSYTQAEGTTLTLAGSLTADTGATFLNRGTSLFNATTTGKTVSGSSLLTLGTTRFAGTNGGWTVSSNASTSDLTIATGTVAFADSLTVNGDYLNTGTTTHSSITHFTGSDVSVAGRLTGASSLYDVVASTSPAFLNDGVTWSARSATEANQWTSLTYGNGLFVAIAYDGTNRVMTSPDGITWTARTAAEANQWRSLTYGNGLFVAVADNGTNRVMTSPDGITWTARSAAGNDDSWSDVVYANGVFVAVGFNGTDRVMTSPDGITWTARAASEANGWYSVVYANSLFVAIAYNGTNRVMTSNSGRYSTSSALTFANDASVHDFTQVATAGTTTLPRSFTIKGDYTQSGKVNHATGTVFVGPEGYNVSNAAFSSIALSVAAQEANPTSLLFNNTGTVLYVLGYTGQDINKYTLTTPYDISTATFSSIVLSVAAQETDPRAMLFNNTGTTLYVMGLTGQDINKYTLTTPYDISTATFSSIVFSVAAQETGPNAMIFNNTGTTLYVMGQTGDDINAYRLIAGAQETQILTGNFTNTNVFYDLRIANASSTSINSDLDTTNLYLGVGTTTLAANKTLAIKGDFVKSGKFVTSTSTVFVGPAGYRLDSAVYSGKSKLVSAQESVPRGVTFSLDGTKMYVVGSSNGTVYQYTLTTPWDVSTASYASKSFSVVGQETIPAGIVFSPDGSKMYVGGQSNDTVYQYTLTTAWDVSTASYASKNKSVVAQETTLNGITFNNFGTIMHILGSDNRTVYQYTLTTPWDVSTASYASKSFSVASQDPLPAQVAFSLEGSKMYMLGYGNDNVYQYTLSIPWDVSTASYASKSFSVASQDATSLDLALSPDGAKMYVLGFGSDTVYQYTLATSSITSRIVAGDFSGTSAFDDLIFSGNGTTSVSGAITADDVVIGGGVVKAPSEMTIAGDYTNAGRFDAQASSTVYFGPEVGNVKNALYENKNKLISSQDTQPEDVYFSYNGLLMYVIGRANDTVYQYTLATAWDVSTASYASKSFSFASQGETLPTGLVFNSDGSSMYVVGTTNDTVYQYTLATAWDVSTASYASKSFSVASQDTIPTDVVFGSDGITMYMVGDITDRVYQYTLATAWDVSTASYASKSYLTQLLAGSATDFTLNMDGTKLYLLDGNTDSVYLHTLSVPYEITTSAYTGRMFYTGDRDVAMSGLYLKQNEQSLYMIGLISMRVFQYTLSSETPTKQIISGNLSGTSAFENVTVTNTSGTGSSTQSVWFASPLEVTKTYTMWASTSAAFPAGATSTILNFTLQGTDYGPVYLRSTTPGTQWGLDSDGIQSVVYTNVRDSNACPGDDIYADDGTSFNAGNNTCWLFPTDPIFTSASNQVFQIGQATTSMAAITLTEDINGASITAANDIRFAIATSTVRMKWDTTDTSAVFGGTASGKVSGTVSYEGNGSVLVIDVTNDFSSTDTLTIEGLSFAQFTAINAATPALSLRIDGASDITANDIDSATVAITGTLTASNHDAGQATNSFSFQNQTAANLFRFKLAPASESATIGSLILNLTGIRRIDSSNLSNLKLHRDINGNGTVDASDPQIGGAGALAIAGQTGSITFSTSWSATTSQNYIVVADVADVKTNEFMTVSLNVSGTVTGVTSLAPITPSGTVSSIQHARGGGIGSGSGAIGGDAPAGNGQVGGGSQGGGEDTGSGTGDTIGNEAGFLPPAATGEGFAEWTNGNAALASDNTYATAASTDLRQSYSVFGFNVPTGNSVQGIEVKLEASGSTGAGTIQVGLSWNGDSSITETKATSVLTGSDAVYTLGGPADLWGRSWTPAEFDNANFFVRVIAQPNQNTVRVDAIQVRPYHQTSGGTSGGGGEL